MAFSAVRRALLGAKSGTDPADDTFGKYRILERLGAGGMGAVFAAWDPELERRVALKVLTGGREAQQERQMIMREAKAAAQLSHPNVVTVFEVGVTQDRVFLAMEYIAGKTLRAWASEAPSATARITVLLHAGRGLAAAHAQGLVHRDFKPDNVLVDEQQQAKVVDFGLAQSSDDPVGGTLDERETDKGPVSPITQTGPRSGTPDYMAPEQLGGSPANARTDQFAFAVTAWELLCGERPFQRNEHAREPRGRPLTGVPRGVMQALTRALSAAPEERFDSMDLLLGELDPAPRAAQRSRVLLGGASVLTIGAVAWGMAARTPPPTAQCTGALARLEGIWDGEHRDRYASAFSAASQDGAEQWSAASDTLSRYADAWVEASTDACEATRVRGEQSDEMFTLRTRCLHGRLRAFRALTGRFEALDEASVLRVADAARDLPPIDACADPEVLTALVDPPPTQLDAEVDAVRDRLASIAASEALGQYELVGEAIVSVVRDALGIEYRALHAEAKYWEGRVHQRRMKLDEARLALEQAVLHATATRHDRLLAESLGLLARVVGALQSNKVAGLAIADQAEAAIDRLGGDPALTAQLASRRGETYYAAGDFEPARAQFELAVEGFTALSPEGPQLADSLANLAAATRGLGDYEAAATMTARALALLERRLGPNHPSVGKTLVNQASLLNALNRSDQARASYERARTILAATFGETHVNIAAIDMNRGNLELDDEKFDAALDLLENVPTRLQAGLPPEHPWVAKSLTSRGRVRVETGQIAEGLADLERAVALYEKTAPESIDLAIAQCRHAWALGKGGDEPGSRKGFAQALSLFERRLEQAASAHPEVQNCHSMQEELSSQ